MKWVTREHVHLDRVAVPWLISRFIDPDAEFLFVAWGEEAAAPNEAIPFAIPGADLGPHDETGTTFDKVITRFGLTDPALRILADVIRAGVAYVRKGFRPDTEDKNGQIAVGLLEISEGMMLLDGDDLAVLEASFPIYDALYRALSSHILVQERGLSVPSTQGSGPKAKVRFLRALMDSGGQVDFGKHRATLEMLVPCSPR